MSKYADLPVLSMGDLSKGTYRDTIPDRAGPFKDMLVSYSHVPREDVDSHVSAVRAKAWAICPYPCVGAYTFTVLSISDHELYPQVLADMLRSKATLADVGCCFAQDLRKLAADGVPTDRLYGTDLRLDFLDLGYEMFQDKSSNKTTFLEGDMLALPGTPGEKDLTKLDGKLDYIHASNFFHLFTWDGSVQSVCRAVKFLRPGGAGVIFGQQTGTEEAGKYGSAVSPEKHRFSHNAESFKEMFEEVGQRTGTKWNVKVSLKKFNATWLNAPKEAEVMRLLEFEARLVQ